MSITTERAESLQAEARRIYRESVGTGEPVSPADLGAQLGRSTRWAQERIREAAEQLAKEEADEQARQRAEVAQRAQREQEADAARAAQAQRGAGTEVNLLAETEASVSNGAARAADDFVPDVSALRETAEAQRAQRVTSDGAARAARGAAGWARLGFWLGLAVSVAANMLHAAQPDAAGAPSRPEVAAAAVWPVFLLISIEILTRTVWPGQAWPRLARFLGALLVAAVAGAESYWHMRGLLLSWGEGVFLASAGPLAVDGLMLLAATSLLVSASRKEQGQ